MNQKNEFKVSIIKNFDVLGLDDTLYDKNYVFTVQCISPKAEYFKIDHKVC